MQLAAQLQVSNRTVSKWENGDGFPDISLLPGLAAALDITIDELLTGEVPAQIQQSVSAAEARRAQGRYQVAKIVAGALLVAGSVIGLITEVRLFWVKPFYMFIEIYLLVLAFVLVVARRVPRMSILVICGIMIGYICSAVTDIVVTFAQDSNIVNLHNWSMGSFSGMTWANVGAAACVVLPALAAAVSALEAHGGLPDGRELRQERRRAGAGLLDGPRAAFQPAFRLRDGLCRPHLLCGHRGAASGQEPAGQRKAPLCPAGLLSGRGSVLPALRPHRPQPVRAH